MLTNLKDQPSDKILALMKAFREDPRAHKIDLGVGVYRNAEGVTPIMAAVKTAEQQLWQTQTTKAYTGLAGDPEFGAALSGMILADTVGPERVACAATPGGTGAVRQLFDLVAGAKAAARVWVSHPTWPNHLSILRHMGIAHTEYRYFDAETRQVDLAGMMDDLAGVGPDDVVLLHGCCHNPTGANLTLSEWDAVAKHLAERGATPMVDLAYQGFGDGLDADAAGLRHLVTVVPETLIAASCSKNFGIYRERTGLAVAVAATPAGRDKAQATLEHLNRQNYSFPPDHGARLVAMILGDDGLRNTWQTELEETRLGMLALRQQLADDLRQRTNSDRFEFLAEHRGMFSRLGATPDQVEALRRDHGIYMVGDSRMNIAGLNATTVPILADAIASVGI